MKREAGDMNGYPPAELLPPVLRDPGCPESLGECAVCRAYREIVADGCSYCLPVSGDSVTCRLDKWWLMKGPSQKCSLEKIARVAELPMCRACLDLAEDIEQIEFHLESRLGDMWNRLKAANLVVSGGGGGGGGGGVRDEGYGDVIQAAAFAAGILDDLGPPASPGPGPPLPKSGPPHRRRPDAGASFVPPPVAVLGDDDGGGGCDDDISSGANKLVVRKLRKKPRGKKPPPSSSKSGASAAAALKGKNKKRRRASVSVSASEDSAADDVDDDDEEEDEMTTTMMMKRMRRTRKVTTGGEGRGGG